MGLHRLTHLVMGVPNVAAAVDFYEELGLTRVGAATLATTEGGEQLRVVQRSRRQVVEIGVGIEDLDDLHRVAANLTRIQAEYDFDGSEIVAFDPGTAVRVRLGIAPRLIQVEAAGPVYNGPGRVDRPNARADGVLREDLVRPRKLGHIVMGSVEHSRSQQIFVEGLGFKISDSVVGRAAFLRCSTDHHNVLIQNAPARFLHHTSWQVEDVDEVGRGATAMLQADPQRHVWGLGRHHIGSNFFWYLKDPAGNFAEYYSDLDCIVDDQLWTPEVFQGPKGLWNWGPPPPPSFLKPDDLANLMADTHG